MTPPDPVIRQRLPMPDHAFDGEELAAYAASVETELADWQAEQIRLRDAAQAAETAAPSPED